MVKAVQDEVSIIVNTVSINVNGKCINVNSKCIYVNGKPIVVNDKCLLIAGRPFCLVHFFSFSAMVMINLLSSQTTSTICPLLNPACCSHLPLSRMAGKTAYLSLTLGKYLLLMVSFLLVVLFAAGGCGCMVRYL